MLHKNSCFLDCLARMLDFDPNGLHARYMQLASLAEPEKQGYHPHVFSHILPIRELVVAPACEGQPLIPASECVRLVLSLLTSNDCVVVGPRKDGGGEHALLVTEAGIWCPSAGFMDTPSINIRSIWVVR
jgi:hypothetical protein